MKHLLVFVFAAMLAGPASAQSSWSTGANNHNQPVTSIVPGGPGDTKAREVAAARAAHHAPCVSDLDAKGWWCVDREGNVWPKPNGKAK